MASPLRVAYLFGAGATHGELTNLEKGITATFLDTKGLLIGKVSSRVMNKARKNKSYLRDIGMVSGVKGPLNIELLISLIENSKIKGYENKARWLKKLVKQDIVARLPKSKRKRFYLHRALLELHEHQKVKETEQLIGLISLNYDTVLDEAYRYTYQKKPNYGISTSASDRLPLLKLHGSFNWNGINIKGRRRYIEIIPLGSNKSYLHVPYNAIWAKALDVLTDCDILRVVGCSFSQNDFHLIDLVFKAHLERGAAFEIQVICPKSVGEEMKDNYGFFPEIKNITEIEGTLVPDPAEAPDSNAFKIWLQYKGKRALGPDIPSTTFLKKLS